MKITRLKISSYRGIAELDVAISPSGALFTGGNARGKTTCVKAIMSCLTSQDISADAIRLGDDKSEILIDIDDHTVRRVITRNSPSKVTVEKDGMKASKAVTYLQELLGTSSLDPLAFYLADAKKRKAQILAALPITVTREQIAKYATDLPLDFDTSGHGLEVVERARKFFYDERTLANKEAAEAKATAERLTKESQALSASVTPGPVVSVEEAAKAVTDSERAIAALEARKREAVDANERTSSQRARIAELRTSAAAALPVTADVESFRVEVANAKATVLGLEENLRVARHALTEAQAQLDGAIETQTTAERAKARAADATLQADSLEAALAAATVTAPTEAEATTAVVNLAAAKALLDRATAQGKALAAIEAATAATGAFRKLEAEAAELDVTVKRLANEAPSELLKASEGIPGLSLDGDEVLLDGKRLDALSGAEQLKFAVEVARRANAKSRILVVDGLERLDPEQMEAFVAHATADNWQLLGTRVSRGELVIESLEHSDEAKAAE